MSNRIFLLLFSLKKEKEFRVFYKYDFNALFKINDSNLYFFRSVCDGYCISSNLLKLLEIEFGRWNCTFFKYK